MKRLFLLGILATGSAWSQVKVSVVGLKIVSKPYQEEGSDQELRAFNWSAGTQVALLIESKGKSIVEMDNDKSLVTVFGDDQGTDFLKAKSRFSSRPYEFDMMAQRSESGKALLTEIDSPGIPAKGAKVLSLKGELKVVVASKSEVKKSAKGAVKEGGKFVIDGKTFTIEETGKPKWGDDEFEITFKGGYDPQDFKSFEFLDADGNKLKSKRGSLSSMGGFGKKKVTVSYSFEKKVSEISMQAEVWTDLEKISVPFDFKFGAGL